MSRVEYADKIALAQPFSPALFRQDALRSANRLLGVLRDKVKVKDLENAWEEIENDRRSKKRKLVDLTWQCGICFKALPWMSFALDTEVDPAKSIDEFILKPGSARCCKKCLHGESREESGKESKLVESYMCKVCSPRRGPRPLKCFAPSEDIQGHR